MKNLLVFTDLDGTLLDHHDYSWTAAAEAVQMLDDRGIPLILNTSKTYAEVRQLREDLNNHHPFIVENGSAVYTPAGYFTADEKVASENFEIVYYGPVRRKLLKIINQLRDQHGYKFFGFEEMSAPELAEITGLSLAGAEKAKQRDCSEPLLWQDTDKALEAFQHDLIEQELQLLKGGRFMHVMGQTDKSNGVEWLVKCFSEHSQGKEFVSVGLGDSPNDAGMLKVVDLPVVIEMASGESMRIEHTNPVMYPGKQGPEGWSAAIRQILEQIERTE